jgi:hypothetical protein
MHRSFRACILMTIGLLLLPVRSALSKDIFVAQGQRTLIAFWKCTDSWYCHVAPCIQIKKGDGSPGRAHLYSEWEPGRSHDLDTQDGQYCDSLDAYFLMAYYLYAVPETDVTFTVGNEIAP